MAGVYATHPLGPINGTFENSPQLKIVSFGKYLGHTHGKWSTSNFDSSFFHSVVIVSSLGFNEIFLKDQGNNPNDWMHTNELLSKHTTYGCNIVASLSSFHDILPWRRKYLLKLSGLDFLLVF